MAATRCRTLLQKVPRLEAPAVVVWTHRHLPTVRLPRTLRSLPTQIQMVMRPWMEGRQRRLRLHPQPRQLRRRLMRMLLAVMQVVMRTPLPRLVLKPRQTHPPPPPPLCQCLRL